MRVLMTTQPGLGHLYPLVPVADGLRSRGHDVLVASSASFAPEIEAAGHRPVSMGIDWHTSDLAGAFPDVTRLPPGPERYAWARRTLFADRTARASAGDLLAIAEQWKPDLIVREAAEYGGCLAAEVLDVPHAVVRTDSGSSSYPARDVVAGSLGEVRSDLGLPADTDTDMPFRYLMLSFAPAGLDDAESVAAPTRHLIAPVPAAVTTESSAPLVAFAANGRPTVYATLGTVYNRLPGLLAAIVEGLATESVNLVVGAGRDVDPDELGYCPPNVRIERWVPQHEVMRHAAVVVSHGGFGTLSAAMALAVPLVLMPISADQPMNAARCADLGVGVVIGPDTRTPDAVRTATRQVLGDPRYACAARRVAQETLARPDLDHALDLLETLARDRRPIIHG